MKIRDISTSALKLMHSTTAAALADEDAHGKGDRGVREYPDWRQQADQFEDELRARGEAFSPIVWARV